MSPTFFVVVVAVPLWFSLKTQSAVGGSVGAGHQVHAVVFSFLSNPKGNVTIRSWKILVHGLVNLDGL